MRMPARSGGKVQEPALRSVAEQDEQELAGTGSILWRQRMDHRDLDALMRAYDEATDAPARQRAVAAVAQRALRHAFAEETVLFPAYRTHLPDSGDLLTAHIEGEHQEVNDLLTQLQELSPESPDYDARVRRAFTVIREDARNEEDVLLPQLQQVAGEAELRTIGAAWETARRVSPTRPHPGVSRRPPGNALAALPLAVADRAKDAIDGPAGLDPGRARSGVARALLGGVVAGAAGVAVMTLGEKVEQSLTGRPDSYVPADTLRALTGWEPRDGNERLLQNWAMHYGQGALLGAVRGLMSRSGHRGNRASAAFTLLRFSTDQALENATGVGAPPWTWPREELAVDVLHKAVYAYVTGLVSDRLVRG